MTQKWTSVKIEIKTEKKYTEQLLKIKHNFMQV